MYAVPRILRILVFATFSLAALVALAGWLVRTRRVSPFGRLGRTLRSVTDPVLRPVEARLVRLGGNPVHAGWWLVVVVAVAGVLRPSLLDWMVRTAYCFSAAATGGAGALFAFLVVAAYNLLVIALAVRVVASWLGWFRYSRWVRPAYALTDWLVEPIRRLLPPAGPIDFSPLVAWLRAWGVTPSLLGGPWAPQSSASAENAPPRPPRADVAPAPTHPRARAA